MMRKPQRAERRTDALSKARIVEAAIEILDVYGEDALTVRALSARLATGSGAIYWHVADKSALLAAATDAVIARVVAHATSASEPGESIRAIALGVFDALKAHPWVGTQLVREPWQSAMLQIFEGVGRQLQAMGVREEAQFDAASALLNFILGVAGQNAAVARLRSRLTDRPAFLAAIAAQWTEGDPSQHPFMRQMAMRLTRHDDREQFLAGVDIILAGIATSL